MKNKVIKFVVWRIFSIIIGITLNGLITGSWHMALGIVFLNSIILTIGQIIFESQWEKKFGTGSKPPEQS
jgi:uncharacterized membrane protein